ncbi:MAG: hypothetical protein ACRELY_10845 [Polyangiaceae bacterium]
MRAAFAAVVFGLVVSLAAIACSSSSSSDTGSSCIASEGGVQSNNASDAFHYDWTCGATSYRIDCDCNELQNPPDPMCNCFRNGAKESSFTWKCAALDDATIAKCNYPTP